MMLFVNQREQYIWSGRHPMKIMLYPKILPSLWAEAKTGNVTQAVTAWCECQDFFTACPEQNSHPAFFRGRRGRGGGWIGVQPARWEWEVIPNAPQPWRRAKQNTWSSVWVKMHSKRWKRLLIFVSRPGVGRLQSAARGGTRLHYHLSPISSKVNFIPRFFIFAAWTKFDVIAAHSPCSHSSLQILWK